VGEGDKYAGRKCIGIRGQRTEIPSQLYTSVEASFFFAGTEKEEEEKKKCIYDREVDEGCRAGKMRREIIVGSR
jgi:hypothetical protein